MGPDIGRRGGCRDLGVDSLGQLGELIQLILSIPEIEGVITDDGANSFYELHKSNDMQIKLDWCRP